MSKRDPFRYFKTSPEIIRLAVMLYVRFPLSLRIVRFQGSLSNRIQVVQMPSICGSAPKRSFVAIAANDRFEPEGEPPDLRCRRT